MSNSLQPHGLWHSRFPGLHYLLQCAQTHWVDGAFQPSHPLPSLLLLPSIFSSISTFSNCHLLTSGGLSIGASASRVHSMKKSEDSFKQKLYLIWMQVKLMLKLKLQYFGHLIWRKDSFEKTLMLGMIEGGRRKGTTDDEMVGWVTDVRDMSLSKL